jgi:heat shock protein HslJ
MPAAGRRVLAKTAVAAALSLVVASSPACRLGSAAGGVSENDPAADAAPTIDELANATYAGVSDEPVTLSGGRWEGPPFVEGGASRPSAGLVEDFVLTGDVDGDGREDAVVLLWESSGGSGTRTYLAVMGRNDDGVVNLGTSLVGDRVQVKAGFIDDGRVVLDLIQAGPNDATCCPTQKALVGWRLVDGVLTRTDSEITGTLSLADLEGTDWVLAAIGWDNPVPGEPSVSVRFEGDKVTGTGGCNNYFGTVTGEAPGHLAFGAMGTTMMACPEPGMDLERRYLHSLARGSTYGFVAGRLVIGCETDDGPVSLIFKRSDGAQSPADDGR